MGRIRAILFDLGDTLIAEIDGPADVDTTDYRILDGVLEVLAGLRKKYKLAIVSNTFSWGDDEVFRALDRKGISKFFDAIITSVDAGSRKPDSGIYLKALKKLQCTVEETIMVGDRVDTDIAGANLIGITSILCRWNDRYPVEVGGEDGLPDFIIGSISELPKLIESLDK